MFESPESQEVMKNVDAIHFIVTKADVLGDKEKREEAARELVRTKYQDTFIRLREYCIKMTKNNRATNYVPQIIPFSLGKFYLGNIYDYDPTDTQTLITTITKNIKPKSWISTCPILRWFTK